MRKYQVWGPTPAKIELQVENQLYPMTRQANGWWTPEIDAAKSDSKYGFMVDGEGPFPDPRSPWQPDGVHSLSRTVDHTAFEWSDSGFQAPPLSSALLYELHVGTFTPEGTFDAAISKLDYLAQLGVTHVELMPVNAFPGHCGWGYDGVALFAVHQPYGGPNALKRFVNACHVRRLAVLLDVVYNHLGPSGNYLAKFGPYYNPCYQTPWGPAVNLNGPQSDEVRRFFCDNALMWLRDYHFDGLRLDAVHAMLDTSARHFLEQLADEVAALESQVGRHLVLIAESDLNDPRLLWSTERGGFGLHAQWSDDFHHALHTLLTGEHAGYYEDFGRMADLAKALTNAYVYDGQHSKHRKRSHGRPHGGLSSHRFLGYIQNHDQIGNRAKGRRLSQLVDTDRLKLAAALVLTAPFVPMLFMGEEWGASTPFLYFADHQEPALAKAVSEGRRKEFAAFGWRPEDIPDPQTRRTFEASKLNWSELEQPPHRELREWHEQLIQLRRGEPSLADGRFDLVQTQFNETERWLVVERGSITVACNFDDSEQQVRISLAKRKVLLATKSMSRSTASSVTFSGAGVGVLKAA
jgi:maltooligosyltrehalose trehalohydrolase